MNVADVLHLPSFASATVIAGASGTTRQVSSAMVLEAGDIENWGREGQMLITSFYALEALNDAELEVFFEETARLGISAFVFKPERLLSNPPSKMIAFCERCSIPLIQIQADTRYEALLLDVLGNVIDSNLTLMNRFYEVHRQIMAFALEQPSVLQILLRLRNIIHTNLTFLDAAKNRRISTDEGLTKYEIAKLIPIKPDHLRANQYFDAQLVYEGKPRHATAARIPSSDDRAYYLVIHALSHELSSIDIMAIENVISLLQMEVLKQNAVKRKLFFRNNNLAHDLLLGHFKSLSEAEAVAIELGIGRYPFYELVMIRVSVNQHNQERLEEVIRALRQRLTMAYQNLAFYETNDRITFIHNIRSESDRFDKAELGQILSEMQTLPGVPEIQYLAAVSSMGTREAIPRLNNEVLDIVRFFDNDRYHFTVITYDELGIYKIFMRAHDVGQLSDFIDSRVMRLYEEAPDLYETAVALCELSLNYHECARQLFVHPKTVRYRAARMLELFDIDVRNSDDRLQISLASRMFKLIDTSNRESDRGM
ncbi:PucR family transcriptional regulator [Collinsella sp. zg1085]|uniref:PucR family transcriptional regulator n=1 Tax=Collinsella sp. zg1085 TaxID=2844380 RepID=UPI001C0DDF46|nr:PucR family transcriptional regulator [Collinsella sp. zg1085]QWT17965.1 PucR family transcriptional regulator [Collinsella sp. zg1085]